MPFGLRYVLRTTRFAGLYCIETRPASQWYALSKNT